MATAGTVSTTAPTPNEQDLVEQLNKAIGLTQRLRYTVTTVFDKLGSGFSNTQENDKKILGELQKSLLTLNNDLGELETVSVGVSQDQSTTIPNSGNLNIDPCHDRLGLYAQLVNAYKWTTKTAEYATNATVILNQNSLKRVSHPGGMSSKRIRRQSNSHTVAPSDIDTLLPNWDRMFNDMSVTLQRPLGSSALVVITLGKTMRAVLSLRGLLIQLVKVRGYHEDFVTDGGNVDLWTPSQYEVFTKVTNHTTAAMLHFYHPLIPEISMRSFLTWLHSYHDLFSAVCYKCKTHLHDRLPPTWRELRNCLPYHEACRP